jgi:quercetin dioxygenase-like cupin family protein
MACRRRACRARDADARSAIGATVTPVLRVAIPNIPGKTLSASVVSYEPRGTSPPPHHAALAFIFAYVLSGAIRRQVGDEPARVYRAGESFFETPGAHHAISENASPTEPAQPLVVFVVDRNDGPLTIYNRN